MCIRDSIKDIKLKDIPDPTALFDRIFEKLFGHTLDFIEKVCKVVSFVSRRISIPANAIYIDTIDNNSIIMVLKSSNKQTNVVGPFKIFTHHEFYTHSFPKISPDYFSNFGCQESPWLRMDANHITAFLNLRCQKKKKKKKKKKKRRENPKNKKTKTNKQNTHRRRQ
eukprot:TRINITY_DN21783_c0_g1_i1.p1 TRINITY_DN21783_c0_g1~~TRINITY_DN21783_c0_g1_i1.p1  ORF type:complete len:167 (+),score=24.60 TRINITY_DN21783_c0_g1_i1:176-676(+)